MPVAACGEVLPLAYGPAQPARVPEDVAVLADVLVDGPVRGPVHEEAGGDLVAAVAVGVGGAQDVQAGAEHVADALGVGRVAAGFCV